MELFFTLNSAGFKIAVSVYWRKMQDLNLHFRNPEERISNPLQYQLCLILHKTKALTLIIIKGKSLYSRKEGKRSKGSLYLIEGKKALTILKSLDRVKNSLNTQVFCSIHFSKIYRKEWHPSATTALYNERKL